MNKNGLIIGIILLVLLVGGFYFLNTYIYNEKQADTSNLGQTVTVSGEVLSVDASLATVDGPMMLTVEETDGTLVNIAIPSEQQCAAEANITDVYDVANGDTIEVQGIVTNVGEITPCNSTTHYLRIQ